MLEPDDIPNLVHDFFSAKLEQLFGFPVLEEYPAESRLVVALTVVLLAATVAQWKLRRDAKSQNQLLQQPPQQQQQQQQDVTNDSTKKKKKS